MHKWFHHFYQCEEVRLNPDTGKFGVFYRPIGCTYPGWFYDFDTEQEAHTVIDREVSYS